MGRRRKEQASQDMIEAVDQPPMFAADESLIEVVPESMEAEEGAPAVVPTKWIVLEDQVVSLFGQMTTLPAGTVVSARSYGPEGVRRIMEQGVLMEPVA